MYRATMEEVEAKVVVLGDSGVGKTCLVLRCAPRIDVKRLTADEQTALDIAEQNDHPAVAAFLRPRTPVSNVFTQGTAPQAPKGMGALVGSAAADVAAAAARAGGEL